MALAGHVKFKSFMRLMGGVAVALGIAGWFLWGNLAEKKKEAERAAEIEEDRRLAELAEKQRVEAEARAKIEAAQAEARAKRDAERAAAAQAAQAERAKLEAALGDQPAHVKALLLDWKGRPLGTTKKKDVTSGRPYKINVYQDAGESTVNRAKVDLDRDDKWDEKWTFEAGGGVTRKIAPRDDEDYATVQIWDGGQWRAGD